MSRINYNAEAPGNAPETRPLCSGVTPHETNQTATQAIVGGKKGWTTARQNYNYERNLQWTLKD